MLKIRNRSRLELITLDYYYFCWNKQNITKLAKSGSVHARTSPILGRMTRNDSIIEMPWFFFLPNRWKTYQHFYEKQRYNLERPYGGIIQGSQHQGKSGNFFFSWKVMEFCWESWNFVESQGKSGNFAPTELNQISTLIQMHFSSNQMFARICSPRCTRHFNAKYILKSGKVREKLHWKVRESQGIVSELAAGNPDYQNKHVLSLLYFCPRQITLPQAAMLVIPALIKHWPK